ncbi:MAG: DEAD/DEAH box helicase [Cyclobacteriaceae bacterium]
MSGLSQRIYNLESTQRQLKSILIDSVSSNFINLAWEHDKERILENVDWNNLLSCASILAQSQELDPLDSALRIAQHCLNNPKTNESQKTAAAVILETLTNKPAIELAIKRKLIQSEYRDSIPLPLKIEILNRDIFNTLIGKDDSLIFLNRFQKEVYESYLKTDLLSISAPTSAGKSFILERIILEEITRLDSLKHIVFIVPTRALISQVEQEIRLMLYGNGLEDIYLTTVPQQPDESFSTSSKIFVFTQERLHWFRTEMPSFKIDLLIIDEAHKIADGNRGILLQQKIEELISDFPDVKIYFSSPFTSNPEFLLEDLSKAKTKAPIKTEFISVNQNLIYVSQKRRKPLDWEVKLCSKRGTIELGKITLKYRPTPESKRLIFVAAELADPTGGNIIYTNRASDAEKAAQILMDTLPDEYSTTDEEIEELIKLVKKTVHSRYVLSKVLKKKIAFHYGNMPLIIRQEIERLFKNGKIHFIICTSTLLEGVNLPAKSIFIRRPTRGIGNPMNDADFWNLAGRAGRWGKEFQGNVVCVEPDLWERPPTVDRKKLEIRKAVDNISNRKDELIAFIQQGTPRAVANRNLDLEYGFVYYYIKYLRNNLIPNNDLTVELQNIFSSIRSSIEIPDEIIFRNPGISPIAQQNILNYFRSDLDSPEQLVPDLPESLDAVNNSYKGIVETINKFLSGDPIELAIYQAILIVNWMKGYPLTALIDSSFKYWQTRAPRKIDQVIRDTMKDIEEFARFKFAKYSSCYIDILRFHFTQIGRDDLSNQIPKLNIWLEFGVSQQTQISLISLGLSRNTAITLSEFIANDNLSRVECMDWLIKNEVSGFDISPIMINEISRIIGESK